MRRQITDILGRGLVAGLLALGLSGCVTNGQTASVGPNGEAGSGRVAFESIDGPPPETFKTLVAELNKQAEARKVPVAARSDYAPYRIRAYVAASEIGKETVFSWVWDVYDGETGRAVRLEGQEKAGPGGTDAWQLADEALLAKMAQDGMSQLASFLANPAERTPAETQPAGESSGIAAMDEKTAPAPDNAAAQPERLAAAHAS